MSDLPDTRLLVWPTWPQWWRALRWVALVLAAMVALTLAGSFCDYGALLETGQHPWLPASHCKGCFMCGMTRSFCAMSNGQVRDAFAWNRGGPFLYAGFWIYFAAAVAYAGKLIVARAPGSRPTSPA